MGMVGQILDLKAEERSMVMQAVKLPIKMTSFRTLHRVFSFEVTACPWEPGWAKLWECQHYLTSFCELTCAFSRSSCLSLVESPRI